MNEDKISSYTTESYVYSSHFTFNLLGNNASRRFSIAIYLLYSEHYFCRNVFENNKRIIKRNYANCKFLRAKFTISDLLIMTLTNSHSLIKKIRLALLLKILARSVSLSLSLPGLVTNIVKA